MKPLRKNGRGSNSGGLPAAIRATASPVTAPRLIPRWPWPVARIRLPTARERPISGRPSGVSGRRPAHVRPPAAPGGNETYRDAWCALVRTRRSRTRVSSPTRSILLVTRTSVRIDDTTVRTSQSRSGRLKTSAPASYVRLNPFPGSTSIGNPTPAPSFGAQAPLASTTSSGRIVPCAVSMPSTRCAPRRRSALPTLLDPRAVRTRELGDGLRRTHGDRRAHPPGTARRPRPHP